MHSCKIQEGVVLRNCNCIYCLMDRLSKSKPGVKASYEGVKMKAIWLPECLERELKLYAGQRLMRLKEEWANELREIEESDNRE